MSSFKEYLLEQQKDTVVFAFGRYNPPSGGHILHLQSVRDFAAKSGLRYEIYISKTVDHKKNPVSVDERMAYISKAAPVLLPLTPAINMFTIVEGFANTFVKHLIYMAGSDYFEGGAEKSMLIRLESWAKEKGITLTTQMSRQRESQAELSGTVLRRAAMEDDFETFLRASPIGMGQITKQDVRRMFELTKQGLSAAPSKRSKQ